MRKKEGGAVGTLVVVPTLHGALGSTVSRKGDFKTKPCHRRHLAPTGKVSLAGWHTTYGPNNCPQIRKATTVRNEREGTQLTDIGKFQCQLSKWIQLGRLNKEERPQYHCEPWLNRHPPPLNSESSLCQQRPSPGGGTPEEGPGTKLPLRISERILYSDSRRS